MHYIMIIFSFIILVGLAVLLATILNLNLAEGMIPAVCAVVLVTGCSMLIFRSLVPALLIFFIGAIAGAYLAIARCILKKEFHLRFINTPYFFILVAILAISMAIYAGSFITRVDELRLWALAPKYLLSYKKLYTTVQDHWSQGTVFFDCFFLGTAGFDESALYVVHALLCWIGLLLPFGGIDIFPSADEGITAGQNRSAGQGNSNGQSRSAGYSNPNSQNRSGSQSNSYGANRSAGQSNVNGQNRLAAQNGVNGQNRTNGQNRLSGQNNPGGQNRPATQSRTGGQNRSVSQSNSGGHSNSGGQNTSAVWNRFNGLNRFGTKSKSGSKNSNPPKNDYDEDIRNRFFRWNSTESWDQETMAHNAARADKLSGTGAASKSYDAHASYDEEHDSWADDNAPGSMLLSQCGRTVLYVLVIYAALYSLYIYGSRTCSPELPLACWAGGLAGWWITGKRKKTDLIVLVAGLITICLFNSSGGIFLVPLILILVFLKRVFRGMNKKKDIYFYACAIVLAVGTAGLLIIGAFRVFGQSATGFKESWPLFCQTVMEQSLASGMSDLNYTFIFGLALSAALLLITGIWTGKKKSAIVYTTYLLIAAICYLLLIYGVYYSGEVLNTDSGPMLLVRSVSMLGIYMLVMTVSWISHILYTRSPRCYAGVFTALLILFLYGWNTQYIPRSTALIPEDREDYITVHQVKREAEALLEDGDSIGNIYMINQGEDISSAAALFYMGKKVNDYSRSVWKFTPDGGMIYDLIDPHNGISTLSDILTDGRYNYVWIWQPDPFIKKALPAVMGPDPVEEEDAAGSSKGTKTNADSGSAKDEKSKKGDKQTKDETNSKKKQAGKSGSADEEADENIISEELLTGGQLYKVVYKKGKAVKLEYVKMIRPYDNREEYYLWSDN